MGSNQRRRAARREHQQERLQQDQDAAVTETDVPERRDVTVIAGTASASGGIPTGSEG